MQDRLVQLPNGNGHVVINEKGQRIYKTFMVVGESFQCDKDCPYCTAKTTLWPRGNNHWERMADLLAECERAGIVFEYLTMSGNGEPAMNPIDDLRRLLATFDRYDHLFEYRRFQTGGRIFWLPEIFALFRDYVFEITRVSVEDDEDAQILRYSQNYTEAPEFQHARVVFNHCLLTSNFDRLLEDIERYIERFGETILHSLNLKILNVNTFDETQLDNKYSNWILSNGLLKIDVNDVTAILDNKFDHVHAYNPFFDRFEWKHPRGVSIFLYTRRIPYGLPNVVFYKGQLVNYQLQPLQLELPAGVDLKALYAAQDPLMI